MAAKAELEVRLAKMEARVLHGGENLVDKMSALEACRADVDAQLEVQRCASPLLPCACCALTERPEDVVC